MQSLCQHRNTLSQLPRNSPKPFIERELPLISHPYYLAETSVDAPKQFNVSMPKEGKRPVKVQHFERCFVRLFLYFCDNQFPQFSAIMAGNLRLRSENP